MKTPLRDWCVESYDEKGRACSGLSEKGYPDQRPSLPKAADTYNASESGDKGRRNK